MNKARGLIKRGVLGGESRLSQTLRCRQVVVDADGGIDVEGWYLRKAVVGMNNLVVIVIVWIASGDCIAKRWTK